jgi:O-antigen ligase
MERVCPGTTFLRATVIGLMSLSILAPVVRVTGEFWVKVDQLVLPFIFSVYLLMILAGLAKPIRLNAMFLVSAAFCLCVVLSLVYGTQIIGHPLLARDFYELVKPLLPWMFFTVGLEADLSEGWLRALNKALFFSIALICLYAYGQWFNTSFAAYLQPYYSGGFHDDGSLAHYRRVYSTLSNPNYLGMLMTWVIAAFTLGAILRIGSRSQNIVLLVASLATLAMTGSRYGLIDTFLALVLVLLLPSSEKGRRQRRWALLVGMPLVLAAFLAVSSSNQATAERFQQLRNPLGENSLRMRLDGLWRDAADQFLESPVLGHGPAKVIFSNVYTDSEYLQILKQFGLVGLIPYLCLFFIPMRAAWKGFRASASSRIPIDQVLPATWWSLCVSFIMMVISLIMNVGMGTYYNLSLVAFLWIWMGIGVSSAERLCRFATFEGGGKHYN